MEKKTIGKFIAALRRANGYTQLELAEQLNVSDKAVSRWERDECAPEITLLPVLAEIFGVTTDELLRGERAPRIITTDSQEEARARTKSVKQLRNMLHSRLTAYKNLSIVAFAVACAGFLGALICNFALLRARMGFFAAALFYVAAAVCEVIFTNNAAVYDDEDFHGEELAAYRLGVTNICKKTAAAVSALFFATLPFVLLTGDAYAGLTAASWLPYAVGGAFIGFAFGYGIFTLAARASVKANRLALGEHGLKRELERERLLKRFCTVYLAVTLLIGAAAAVVNILPVGRFAKGLEFDDYASFKQYMETVEQPYWYERDEEYVPEGGFDPADYPYAVITGAGGEVLCKYHWVNENVELVEPAPLYKSADRLPVSVYTHGTRRAAQTTVDNINCCLGIALAAETTAVWCAYASKRRRLDSRRG